LINDCIVTHAIQAFVHNLTHFTLLAPARIQYTVGPPCTVVIVQKPNTVITNSHIRLSQKLSLCCNPMG